MRAKQKAAALAARKGNAMKQVSSRISMPGGDGQFMRNLVSHVQQATSLVVLSSYLLQDGPLVDALLEKASSGVFVAVLTAASEDIESLADDELSLFDRSVLENHVHLLDKMAGHILVRTSREYHAKFLLIDPLTPSAFGMLMTCNMTQDAMTGKNIEAGVVLMPEEVSGMYSLFLHGFWNLAQHELLSAGVLSSAASGPALDLGTISIPATYGSSCSLKESVISVISSAQQRIDISCWTFLHPAIAELLYARVAAGIEVNLYVHIPEFPSEMIAQLAAGGVMVYGHPRLHAKTVIADRTYGLLMTANVAEFGMDTGFEAGVFIDDADVAGKLVDEISGKCSQVYSRSSGDFVRSSAVKAKRGSAVPVEKAPAPAVPAVSREQKIVNTVVTAPVQKKEKNTGDMVLSVLNSYLSERKKELKK